MKYNNLYIYPPRPKNKATEDSIPNLLKLGFLPQPKLNGSCAFLSITGIPKETKMMSRHKAPFSNTLLIEKDELNSLHRGTGTMVLTGEYMNKSQKDKNRKVFNGKFVIWDILVYEGEHLVGTTYDERHALLLSLYDYEYFDGWIGKISENTYIDLNVEINVTEAWKEIVQIQMYEGFVFKKKEGKLGLGFNSNNNTGWQVKVRKPTRNYSY